MEKGLLGYREHLVLAEQKSQEDFDKTVILLSGGALGVSFAFVDKFIKTAPALQLELLFLAWTTWTVSVGVVLLSYFLSTRALRKAIIQTDADQIYQVEPGGFVARAVDWCNVIGAILFTLGVILMGIFVKRNLGV